MKNPVAAVLIFALFGCASSSSKIDAARLGEVRKGQTTASEIVAQFGRPSMLSKNMDGTQTAIYVNADGKTGASVVPAVGLLGSNAETVTFYYDDKGVLTDYKVTQPRTNAATPDSAAQTPQATAVAPDATSKPTRAGAAQPAKGATTLNLPSLLPSATKDPRNP